MEISWLKGHGMLQLAIMYVSNVKLPIWERFEPNVVPTLARFSGQKSPGFKWMSMPTTICDYPFHVILRCWGNCWQTIKEGKTVLGDYIEREDVWKSITSPDRILPIFPILKSEDISKGYLSSNSVNCTKLHSPGLHQLSIIAYIRRFSDFIISGRCNLVSHWYLIDPNSEQTPNLAS